MDNNEPVIQAVSDAAQPSAPTPDGAISAFDMPTCRDTACFVRTYTTADTVMSLVCFGLGFVFTHFVCSYAGGIWGGILWLLVGIAAAVYVGIKGIPVTWIQKLSFAVAQLFCFVPLFCSNTMINTLAAVFSFMLLFYTGISLSGAELFGKHFIGDLCSSVFVRPLESFGDAPRAVGRVFRKADTGKNIGFAIVGLVLAVPLTLVVLFLLMSSDSMFEDNMDKLWEWLPDFDFLLIVQLLMALPVGMYLFGMMSSAAKKRQHTYDDTLLPCVRLIPPALGYTMVTPVCVLYLLYIVTQFNYFTAAFGGTLPAQYSYSSYARRGFFELCVIAVINLCIIIAMQLFMKRREDDSRPVSLKIYTTVISSFTLLLIASAISKMLLYIGEMGMTPLRIYTSWFMLLLAVIFVVIIVMQYISLPMWRVLFAAFSILMAVLCFGNIDGMIADYNITAYEDGRLSEVDFDVLNELGDAAVVHIARLADDERYSLEATDALQRAQTSIERTGNAYFSIPRALGTAELEKLDI